MLDNFRRSCASLPALSVLCVCARDRRSLSVTHSVFRNAARHAYVDMEFAICDCATTMRTRIVHALAECLEKKKRKYSPRNNRESGEGQSFMHKNIRCNGLNKRLSKTSVIL